MFLIPLVLVTRRYMGHWGGVEAVGGQVEVEVSQVEDEAQLREEVRGISKSGGQIIAIYMVNTRT